MKEGRLLAQAVSARPTGLTGLRTGSGKIRTPALARSGRHLWLGLLPHDRPCGGAGAGHGDARTVVPSESPPACSSPAVNEYLSSVTGLPALSRILCHLTS
jgi:hypothetical protein